MNFIRKRKMLFNADVSRANTDEVLDSRSLTNIRIVSVHGDYQYIVEIANFNIYITYWKLTD